MSANEFQALLDGSSAEGSVGASSGAAFKAALHAQLQSLAAAVASGQGSSQQVSELHHVVVVLQGLSAAVQVGGAIVWICSYHVNTAIETGDLAGSKPSPVSSHTISPLSPSEPGRQHCYASREVRWCPAGWWRGGGAPADSPCRTPHSKHDRVSDPNERLRPSDAHCRCPGAAGGLGAGRALPDAALAPHGAAAGRAATFCSRQRGPAA